VKAIQRRKGSRTSYERMEAGQGWSTTITADLADFIAAQTSVFFGTASADGQPYIQHRGGPPGFLRVLDERTVAFADYRGNRQYISQGNLADNPKAFLFLIDYAHRQRIKIWGEARVVENDPPLVQSLMPRATRRALNRHSSSPFPHGIQTARSTYHSASRPPMSRLRSRNAIGGSKS